MLMLALLASKNPDSQKNTKGFTLLEILIVLLILGLSAAVVFPNLPLLIDRVSYSNKRKSFDQQLNSLPHAAIRNNQDIILSETLLRKGLTNEKSNYVSEQIYELAKSLNYQSSNLYPASIEIPENWSIKIPNPIIYRSSGLCLGGELKIKTTKQSYDIRLLPPSCKITNLK